ncbi:hypothetical protein Moror_11676 [Moniliophthora roreri MCA 2997]|uniref:DUF6534 domain-containing protein n=2 Tax=Moniliophthora roreri TaxID=221103 RepID=V2X3P1_MONRO|nr:hypothetical protein Moror_11676 [Moniliophthora roreri MCA 2997]KAI3619842.1 hypothetical protein WG66_002695 [Moniliophthora roreri]
MLKHVELDRQGILWLTMPRLASILLNYFLMGTLTVQIYSYHLHFHDDKLVFKVIAYGIYILEWAQTLSATYDASQWFTFSWGDVERLAGLYSSFLNIPLLSSVIGGIVQVFFGWRIWTFYKSKSIYTLIIILAVVQMAGAIGVATYLVQYPDQGIRSPGLVVSVGVRLATSALVDILIASCITYFLLRKRCDNMSLDAIVTRLARLTIETGCLTAIAALLDLAFFLYIPKGALHQTSALNISKLYSNSLMMFFNNRALGSLNPEIPHVIVERLPASTNRQTRVIIMLPDTRTNGARLQMPTPARRLRPFSALV